MRAMFLVVLAILSGCKNEASVCEDYFVAGDDPTFCIENVTGNAGSFVAVIEHDPRDFDAFIQQGEESWDIKMFKLEGSKPGADVRTAL
ncbi:MAG: hypothetical protein WAZ14_02790 [Patescibacteria group bacterium]